MLNIGNIRSLCKTKDKQLDNAYGELSVTANNENEYIADFDTGFISYAYLFKDSAWFVYDDYAYKTFTPVISVIVLGE